MGVRWAEPGEATGKAGDFARLFARGTTSLIANVDTECRVLRVNEEVYFPVTVDGRSADNAFVCSPYATYIRYARGEVGRKVSSAALRWMLYAVIRALSLLLRRGEIDKNVHVNNFLLSTNPYPRWGGEEIDDITSFLKSHCPGRAIVFRSLNAYQHNRLLEGFASSGYRLLASRQVYIFDLEERRWLKRRNNKHDAKLVARSGLKYVPHEGMAALLPQALELYRKLYLQKYSRLNPQFTLRYFRECHAAGLIDFQGYTDDTGALRAFSGQFSIGDTLTSPLVGYDTGAPRREGLYIHAARLALLAKFETGHLLNLSSGAPKFKRMRGGEPSIEYSAVYVAHLPLRRRLPWALIRLVSNRIGVPLLKRLEL